MPLPRRSLPTLDKGAEPPLYQVFRLEELRVRRGFGGSPVLTRYKLEAAAAIVEHFKTKALVIRARALVPQLRESIAERPPMPPAGSSAEEWRAWHLALADLYGIIATHQSKLTEHDQRLARHDDEIAALADDEVGVREALIIMGEMVHDIRISPQQENEIHALVSKIHDATGIHQATIFAAFKRQWKIARYDEIPMAQFDDAIEWLRQWGRARLAKKPK